MQLLNTAQAQGNKRTNVLLSATLTDSVQRLAEVQYTEVNFSSGRSVWCLLSLWIRPQSLSMKISSKVIESSSSSSHMTGLKSDDKKKEKKDEKKKKDDKLKDKKSRVS